MNNRNHYGNTLGLWALGFLLFFSGCSQPSFLGILNGPDGLPLTVTPASAQIVNGETIELHASGGMPPYTYVLSPGIGGSGEDLTNNIYTAPSDVVGTAHIDVKDSYGGRSRLDIEVVSASGSGPLGISPVAVGVYAGRSVTFTAYGGDGSYSFELSTSLGGTGESLTSSGNSASYTAPMDVEGDAVVKVTDGNGTSDEATIAVSAIAGAVDYALSSLSNTGGTSGGGAISGSLSVINNGSENGAHPIHWEIYTSLNGVLDAGDVLIDSGTVAALDASEDSGLITFSGTWPVPVIDTSYSLIATVSAGDDLPDSDNIDSISVLVSAPLPGDIDYVVASITNVPSAAEVGTPISQSFVIQNDGDDPGSSTIFWTAYVSRDSVWDIGDVIVDAGTHAALTGREIAGDITVSGYWPSSAGVYYLIVKIAAGDDVDPGNNISVSLPFTIGGSEGVVDYYVSNISRDYPTVISGGLCSETFDITNLGGDDGVSGIAWTAYASTDMELEVGSDTVVGSSAGNDLPALSSGSSRVGISLSGNWPESAGLYYLFVVIEAADDSTPTNNQAFAGPFNVKNPPDYKITSTTFQTEGEPGTALSESGVFDFVISEIAGADGSHPISWKVYASTDTALDANDWVIKSGTIGALSAWDDSGVISFSDAEWPLFGSYYYLIISVSAYDDDNRSNDSSVSPPVMVPEFVTESDDSTDHGPTDEEMFNVTNLFPDLDGNETLDRYQLIRVNGTFVDDWGSYDSFKFVPGAGVTTIEVSAEWVSTTMKLSLYLWDENNNEWVLGHWLRAADPDSWILEVSGLIEGTPYYIGIEFADGLPDDIYDMYIFAR